MFLHLLNLWLWPLIFEPQGAKVQNHKISRISQGISLYTEFEHFGIFRFWVMLQTNRQTDKQTDRQSRKASFSWFQYITTKILIIHNWKHNTYWLRFDVRRTSCSQQTDRQTDKQTDGPKHADEQSLQRFLIKRHHTMTRVIKRLLQVCLAADEQNTEPLLAVYQTYSTVTSSLSPCLKLRSPSCIASKSNNAFIRSCWTPISNNSFV